jgi:hypothetical protein
MAADNVLNVKIQATITELQKALNQAEKEVTGFGGKTESTFKKAASTTKPLTTGIFKSAKAMQVLDTKTQGVSTALVNVGKAARLSGAAMRSALIASGIGAAVVALGLIVQHWDAIKEAITGANKEYDKFLGKTKTNDRFIQQQKDELALVEALREQYAFSGRDATKLDDRQRTALLELQKLTNDRIEDLKEIGRIELANFNASSDEEQADPENIKRLFEIDAALGQLKVQAVETATAMQKFDGTLDEVTITAPKTEEGVKNLGTAFQNTFDNAFNSEFSQQLGIVNSGLLTLGETAEKLSTSLNADNIINWGIQVGTVFSDISEYVEENRIFAEDNAISIPDLDQEAIERNKEALLLYFAELEALAKEFNNNFTELVKSSISQTLAGIGNAIGTALGEGGDVLSALGTSLLKSLGGFLSQFGTMLIEYAISVSAFAGGMTAVESGAPPAMFAGAAAMAAAGVALTLIGGLISSSATAGFGGGGGGGGGSAGGAGASGGTTPKSATNFGSIGGDGIGGTFVFEIQGTKLIGVIQNTLDRNRSLGGREIFASN